MEIKLELNDETPFLIRPFPIKETEKDVVDKEMRKGCMLGILKKGMSSYSSPIMLIPRKITGIPRIVTDFRHLNSRLVTLQPSIPLVCYFRHLNSRLVTLQPSIPLGMLYKY